MNSFSKIFKFNKFFNFYYYYNYNFFFCILNIKYIILKLPSIIFFKSDDLNYQILFLKKEHYKSFIKHLFNFYNKFFNFYYYNLKLKGLGFRVFIVSNKLIKIFLNRSNFFYLHIPLNVLLKYKTRQFFFISLSLNDLKLVVLNLLVLKEFVIYRISGIHYERQIILRKPGKNKFR